MKAIQLVPAMEEGGVERYVVQLNRILVGAGWKNMVVSRGGALAATIVADGGSVVFGEMKSKNPFSAPLRAWWLRRLLKRERPDVVCAHSRVPAWLFVMASWGLGIRWITYAHGANSISRYSRVMTKGERVLCPSTFIRDYLMRAYGVPAARFCVIPHGLDAARFDPAHIDAAVAAALRRDWKLSSDVPVVMSIGRLTRLKGFDALIRALALMPRPRPRLVLIGGAEKGKEAYRDELKALVAELGLGDDVVFAGPQSCIPECLSLATVVVSANTQKPEAFGLTMAEALMMNVPVVAKAFGGACDIVRDGQDGILVSASVSPAAAPQAFAEAISHVLHGPLAAPRDASIRASAQKRFDYGIMVAKSLAVFGLFGESKKK